MARRGVLIRGEGKDSATTVACVGAVVEVVEVYVEVLKWGFVNARLGCGGVEGSSPVPAKLGNWYSKLPIRHEVTNTPPHLHKALFAVGFVTLTPPHTPPHPPQHVPP